MSGLHPLLQHLARTGRIAEATANELQSRAQSSGQRVEDVVLSTNLLPRESLQALIVSLARVPTLEEALLSKGLLSAEELARLGSEAVVERISLAEHLSRSGTVTPLALSRTIAELHGLPTVDLSEFTADEPLFRRFDIGLLQRVNVLPIREEQGRTVLAIDDPGDVSRVDEIRSHMGPAVQFVVAPAAHIQRVINNVLEATVTVTAVAAAPGATGDAASELASGAVVELLDQVLGRAVRKGASDIHLEPYGPFLKIKIRLDGVLREMGVLESRLSGPLISRIKVLSRMDISEKRLPQDGRLQIRVDGRPIDMRVSTLPTIYGETAVLRILDKTQLGLDLDNLGIPDKEKVTFKRAISRPYGMVLVAGPTGSGKTTTLYSAVRAIHSPGLKFMTIEDPVEYQMMDVVQVPVNEKQGLTFAGGLRSIVRQDPNKILVGEVRDLDTAKIAVNAALTGHMVLTTIHANDALEAILRLTGLGIQPRDFASSLNLILSQRLMRRVCSSCKEPLPSIPGELREVIEDLDQHADVVTHVGRGCAVCHRSGYVGRTGIYEVLPVDDDLRELMISGASPVKLRQHARARGLKSLREAAWELVRSGQTTLEELSRVTVAS
ncbi:MAG: type II/IV secretion system protein [Candidatus Riflebacteria bacterium]|nr:type II/IV secretion system protein [Candidatus Riflebacteria bacterium]